MKRSIPIALTPALLIAASAAQSQVIYTTSAAYQGAATTTAFYDFEGIVAPSAQLANANLSPLIVTISGGENSSYVVAGKDLDAGNYSLNGTDSLLAGLNNGSVPTTTIQLGGFFTGFGTEIGFRNRFRPFPASTVTVSLFNGNSQVGNSYTSPSFVTGFLGFTSAAPFDRILFTQNVITGGYTTFDNLRTGNAIVASGTPEPGSLALLSGLGAAGAGLLRRCRRR